MTKPILFIALFVVGALTMFLFDNTFTLLLGMALQVAAIIFGVFTIATPDFLEGEKEA